VRRSAEELGDLLARRRVDDRRTRTVKILVRVEMRHAIDDAARFLCRRGIVQVDQRLAADALGEHRKVTPAISE
jgi:hypothetical protein